jgi:hypothetical protein
MVELINYKEAGIFTKEERLELLEKTILQALPKREFKEAMHHIRMACMQYYSAGIMYQLAQNELNEVLEESAGK